MCRVWAGRDGWATLPLVTDCHTRELLDRHLSRSGKASTASSALEHALIARFGTLGRVPTPFLLRSDNGLVFMSRDYTALARGYGLRQEFITPHCPQQNGMVTLVQVVLAVFIQTGFIGRRTGCCCQMRSGDANCLIFASP